MRLAGRTAVVTGAAGGIGRAVAGSLSRRGCHLALVDIDADGLARLADRLSASGVRRTVHVADVSDAEAVTALPGEVVAAHQQVDILVNNAGVALGGSFEQVPERDFEWLFGINFWGVVRMTRAFLPLLRTRDEARLVNLSSVFGLIAPPGHAAYAASKFAVRGFSESLRHELKGSPVGVTVVYPGGIRTSIARNARLHGAATAEEAEQLRAAFEAALTLSPEIAGERIVRAVERRQPRVLIGRDARIVSTIERIAPVSHWKLLERIRKLGPSHPV